MASTALGIDLAWGERARTGVAVLDSSGALKASASVVGDAEIDAFIAKHCADAQVVAAIDAPIVVRNATGQRPCEREIGRLFGRYRASAHPSNLSRPHFSPEPRALRLVRRWGWQIDPLGDAATGFAMEVYLHAAMVSLFELDRVLPYKAKHRRTLEERKQGFTRLIGFMEQRLPLGLAENGRWAEIKNVVVEAHRHAELEAVEDEVDAIFCAHLAWLWSAARERLILLGDAESGYIVTPSPPSLAGGAA